MRHFSTITIPGPNGTEQQIELRAAVLPSGEVRDVVATLNGAPYEMEPAHLEWFSTLIGEMNAAHVEWFSASQQPQDEQP